MCGDLFKSLCSTFLQINVTASLRYALNHFYGK